MEALERVADPAQGADGAALLDAARKLRLYEGMKPLKLPSERRFWVGAVGDRDAMDGSHK